MSYNAKSNRGKGKGPRSVWNQSVRSVWNKGKRNSSHAEGSAQERALQEGLPTNLGDDIIGDDIKRGPREQ